MKKIPTRKSIATHELYFVVELEPVSYKTFYVRELHLHHTSSDDQSSSEHSSEQDMRYSLYIDPPQNRRSSNKDHQRIKSLCNNQHRQRRLTSNNNYPRKRRSLSNGRQLRIQPIVNLNSTRNYRGNGVQYLQRGSKYFPRRNQIPEVEIKDQLADEKFTFRNRVST